jgi:hypothetical protein
MSNTTLSRRDLQHLRILGFAPDPPTLCWVTGCNCLTTFRACPINSTDPEGTAGQLCSKCAKQCQGDASLTRAELDEIEGKLKQAAVTPAMVDGKPCYVTGRKPWKIKAKWDGLGGQLMALAIQEEVALALSRLLIQQDGPGYTKIEVRVEGGASWFTLEIEPETPPAGWKQSDLWNRPFGDEI